MKSELTEQEKQRSAWVITLSISGFILFICYGIYKIHDTEMFLSVAYYSGILLGVIFLGLGILAVLVRVKNHVYYIKFGDHKHDNWDKNAGFKPTMCRVSVEYADGKKVWNVNPDTLDWSLDILNPIKSYIRK